MTDQHPITPPPELIEDWIEIAKPLAQRPPNPGEFATLAARWGANQELEACVEWFVRDWTDIETADKLRAARRPKPPSLKEQALDALHGIHDQGPTPEQVLTIRLALQQLND